MSRGTDRDANLSIGLDTCRVAKEERADIALFPEMWSIGYTFPKQSMHDSGEQLSAEEFAAIAEPPDGPWVGEFRALAIELEMAIAITYLERTPAGSRNTVSVFDRRGNEILRYAKAHLCDFQSEGNLEPGREFPVVDLETAAGPVRIAAMICYDREFPEPARLLMLDGAELVLVPNACTIDDNRMAQLRTRSFENMYAVAMANYAAPQHNGRSVVFDGVAHDEHGRGLDPTVVEASDASGVIVADLDLERLRDYREKGVWGPKFRHPELYGRLSAPRAGDTGRLPSR